MNSIARTFKPGYTGHASHGGFSDHSILPIESLIRYTKTHTRATVPGVLQAILRKDGDTAVSGRGNRTTGSCKYCDIDKKKTAPRGNPAGKRDDHLDGRTEGSLGSRGPVQETQQTGDTHGVAIFDRNAFNKFTILRNIQ
jgi:hypothetical protein